MTYTFLDVGALRAMGNTNMALKDTSVRLVGGIQR